MHLLINSSVEGQYITLDVVASVLDSDIKVSEFELQLHYNVHFWNLEVDINSPSYVLNSTTIVLQEWLWN